MEERRKVERENREAIILLKERMDLLESQTKVAIASLSDMISINNDIRASSKEVVDLMRTVHTGLRVIGSLAKVAKWITVVGGAIALLWGMYSTIKNGTPPVIHIGLNDD